MAPSEARAPVVIVSIPVSPYVEVARWVLDHLGIAYHEQCHAPFVHLPAALRHGGGRDVPVVSAPGVSLANARAVLEHYAQPGGRLYPDAAEDHAEVDRLVSLFYDGMGVAVRAWAYSYMLPERESTARLWSTGAPPFERLVVRCAYPVLAAFMRRALSITAETPERSLIEIDTVFDQVEALLSDGRRYLVGDRFTVADLVFGALVGPAVLPDGYGGPLPAPSELPVRMRSDYERLRDWPAGAYALRLYREDRRSPAAPLRP